MSSTRFSVDYSKRVSKCKKCKVEMEKQIIRLAKIVPNPFGDDGDMKQYYHVECLFETFTRARANTKVIESADDIEEFEALKKADKDLINDLIKKISKDKKSSPKKVTKPKKEAASSDSEEEDDKTNVQLKPKKEEQPTKEDNCDDNRFETFNTICNKIARHSSHLEKTDILKKFFQHGINKDGYKGDMYVFIKLLLPSASTRVFNLSGKQLVKLFSRIFSVDHDEMLDHLNQGDISETVRFFFNQSEGVTPKSKSTLTIFQADAYLDKLTTITKEADQLRFLEDVAKKCTESDLRLFIRLIKKDLKIDAMAKIILDSVAPNAYQAFQVSRDLKDVVSRANQRSGKPGLQKNLSVNVHLMTPFKPMLAEACKSVEQAFVKCKNQVMAEVKYDGERLQVHKNGSKFNYFSRNLKEVPVHKVSHLKEYIPKAFPSAQDLILDAEVLLYDTIEKKPLPFGTLGVHKKNEFKDATVCLFIFDCLYLNGKDLMNKPLDERRKILEENVTEIPGRIMLSDQRTAKTPADLRKMIMEAIHEGLEGLVLKDSKSVYEPGKRHWLKMKKDYLDSGSMADTADLVVLGAYYGTGNKGGMKSVFLMGTYDERRDRWFTVTKVGNGFDDETIKKLQKQIEMVEIKKNADKVPDWLVVNKSLVPDFVVKDPKKSPVWELTGAEFSKSETHTADGISIRFPRVTRVRGDKSWKEATNLSRLKELFKVSKEKTDVFDEDDSQSKETKATTSKNTEVKKPVKRSSTLVLDEIEESSKKPKVDTVLPSIFQDRIFFVSKEVPKFDKLKRYILAYDGKVVDEAGSDEATHVIVASKQEKMPSSCSKKVVIITDSKMWECIKNKKFN